MISYIPCHGNILRITPGVHIPEQELHFSFSRSGGPGGQTVNKLATRVELRFDVAASPSLSDDQKMACPIGAERAHRFGGRSPLRYRSREANGKNRCRAVERFVDLLQNALRIRPVGAGRSRQPSRERRYAAKKKKSVVKRLRRALPAMNRSSCASALKPILA